VAPPVRLAVTTKGGRELSTDTSAGTVTGRTFQMQENNLLHFFAYRICKSSGLG